MKLVDESVFSAIAFSLLARQSRPEFGGFLADKFFDGIRKLLRSPYIWLRVLRRNDIFGIKLFKFFIWSISVDDASGRFTNGFFWGNSYFTGSATECDYIGQKYTQKRSKIAGEFEEVRKFNAEPRRKVNVGLSGKNSWTETSFSDTPPYHLGFFMMRISINASRYTSVSRLLPCSRIKYCFCTDFILKKNLSFLSDKTDSSWRLFAVFLYRFRRCCDRQICCGRIRD